MSDILNSAISGMNAMKIMIDNTIDKINHPNNKTLGKRVVIENTVQNENKNSTVKVKEIYDNYNDFILEEKRKTNAEVQDEQTKIEQLLKLEDLLCEKSNIFSQLLNDYYAQIEEDIVLAKKNVFNENIQKKLSNIVFAIKDFDKKLKFLEKDIKDSVINNLKKVNSLIDEIHDLTIDIRCFPVLKFPNRVDGLIEQRDRLVDELNGLIGIKVIKDHDNYKLNLNNGISIIDNNKKQNLIALTSTSDERYISVGYVDTNDKVAKKIEDMIPTATLGALLKFRREELTNTRNKIGQLIINFADSINSYHAIGYDMFGHLGRQIFNISQPEVIASSSNRSSSKVSAKWLVISDAKNTNYVIYFKDKNFIVTRLSDHSTIQPKVHVENNKTLFTFDGIECSIEGENADNDIYMIKPYSKTLEELELLINPNEPFAYSSTDDLNNPNRNNAIIINKFYNNVLVDHKETLDQAYQKFSQSISHKCNALEEEVPFKRNMIGILENKKMSISNDMEQEYAELNYEQECYLANVKVLQTAENILNEIIERYS
ncbi:flagellar hook-associated protein FlgK [Buchnera aphidicola]|uniref:flagellar hook-associated protein FlgK n=1 Tax=Buchnera aphidicola TaxID=9 RepID=UPI000189C6C7|nr:flagellar hook-associated protein FlgK [Buchnera aphidicola]ACL30149.1 flagellar hook-associated protein 1 [Buchnera aphidicola str. Tuc7 (Acyrthosiphon pisum)]ADP66736.1 flagellar hook-associated protein 1 [Buchnera aphidicola str. TLW03 (Acyrthosiphon pisum)]ADP67321.1 flagellar hook-associated protein 1 [Buchnera aphidicola str. JF99 (Acyrthosiphon pisum)]